MSGSDTQNQFVWDRIDQLKSNGATEIRVNQQQVNYAGKRVGVNRPDLQYNQNGKRFYEEYDRSSSTRGPGHRDRILANDETGIVVLFDIN